MTDPLTLSTHCPPDAPGLMPLLRCAGRWFNEIELNTPMADSVTSFIQRRFLQAYGAEPKLRIPSLLALTTAQGSLIAATGVRNASRERLFLEDYLSAPVENLLPVSGVGRNGIAEIAHMAGVEAGVSRYLFTCLSVWLSAEGYEWVVCTSTVQLSNGFHRLGIPTHVIDRADPARLPDGGNDWGRYYEQRPMVIAIRIQDAIDALRKKGILNLVQTVSMAEPGDTVMNGGGL